MNKKTMKACNYIEMFRTSVFKKLTIVKCVVQGVIQVV